MNLKISFNKINREMPMVKNLHLFLFLLSLLSVEKISAQETYNALVYDGNAEFKSEKYDKASSKFMEAIKINPKDFSAHYNLGNSLYKSKKYEEAEAEYQKAKALAKTNTDKMATLYNQGNVAMQKNNPEKASELYKQALKHDPYNENVRKNFEIAMLKKQEQKNKQGKNKEQKNDNNKQENKDGKGEEKGNDPQKNSGGKDQDQQGKGKGNEEKQNGQENGLPKELRDAIMEKVGEKERNTTRKILNKKAYSMPDSNEKDW